MHGSIKDGSPSSSGNIPFMRMIMVTTVMPHSLGLSSIARVGDKFHEG